MRDEGYGMRDGLAGEVVFEFFECVGGGGEVADHMTGFEKDDPFANLRYMGEIVA